MNHEPGPAEDGPAAAPSEPRLKLRGIDKHFGPVQALYQVNLDLPAGQVTSLCGDNGAGKSVLTRCIAGVHQPDHGQIFFEGEQVHIRTTRDAASLGIETVYQDLALADNLDIVQNMFLGRERLRRGLLDEDSMERAAAETLSSLRVTTVRSIRQPVASLSGGQRQSAAVAKAARGNSKVVLAGEPPAALGGILVRLVLGCGGGVAPAGLDAQARGDATGKVFEAIKPLDPARVVFGQYDGYQAEPGVAPDSRVETFAALDVRVDNQRWADVPFQLRTGKALAASRHTVTLGFKQPAQRMFELIPEASAVTARPNEVTFELSDPGVI